MSQSLGRFSQVGSAPSWPRLIGKAAVALVACLAVRILWAQAPPAAGPAIPEAVDARGYKVWVPFATLWADGKPGQKARDAYTNVRKTLGGEQPFADGRAFMENYYNLFYFPRMTQTSDNELKSLPTERQIFLRDHLEYSGKQTEAHNLLTSLALARMTAMVRDDKFHPAVRYNAMMIIGSLNDQEPVRSGTTTLPVPMSRALPIVFDEFKRPENIDAVKMPALLGLARHLEWENDKPAGAQPMQAGLKQEIIKELIVLAQAAEPPAGRDAAGHVWFRRRAVEALGLACLRKPDAEVADALDALLKDQTQPVALRCTVAATVGRISYQAPAKVDPQAMAKELGYLALVAVDSELNRLTSLRKDEEEHAMRLMGQIPDSSSMSPGSPLSPRGMPGGGGYGGYGEGGGGYAPMPGAIRGAPGGTAGLGTTDGGYGGTPGVMDPSMMDPKAYRFDPARRRIRQELYCIQLGLTGGEDHKEAKGNTSSLPMGTGAAGGTASGPKPELRGMWVLAKAGSPEKKFIDDVYGSVRKLIEVVETKALDLNQLDKDLRKEMKNVETTIDRKLAPPVTQAVATGSEDVPGGAEKADSKTGKKGSAKGPGGKAAAPKGPMKGAPAAPRPMAPVKAAAASGR